MFRRILFCRRDNVMMRSLMRARCVSMHQVSVGSGNANGCQNEAKSEDED